MSFAKNKWWQNNDDEYEIATIAYLIFIAFSYMIWYSIFNANSRTENENYIRECNAW